MSYAWTVAATLLLFGLLCLGDRETEPGGMMAMFMGGMLAIVIALLWAGKMYL